jgi:hypothetical protein
LYYVEWQLSNKKCVDVKVGTTTKKRHR